MALTRKARIRCRVEPSILSRAPWTCSNRPTTASFSGRYLAIELGVRIGDGVVLLIPRPSGDGTLESVLERFTVQGVFEAGVQDHDSSLALIHIDDAARLLSLGRQVNALRFLSDDVMSAPAISAALRQLLGAGICDERLDDRERELIFAAIRLEKMMMSLLLSLIIGVAAFNVVASLVMVVTDKTTDIAILRTLGMGPGDVVRVFFIQGAVIGWLGGCSSAYSVVCCWPLTCRRWCRSSSPCWVSRSCREMSITSRPFHRSWNPGMSSLSALVRSS